MDGEQRGAALADFDNDGRVDLVVTQNAAATRLYRNQDEAKGLRVRFEDGADGAGAVLRLVYEDGTKGPARAVQAVAGYWSANATTQVLGAAGEAVAVEVAWPSGRITTAPLEPGQAEVALAYPPSP